MSCKSIKKNTLQRARIIESMIKMNKCLSATLVAAFMLLSLVGDNALLFAATPEKQLEKGKALFEEEKNDEALEYFIDVLLTGNRKQVTEANKYVNMIHNRIGGIQNPVEVDVAFKEGEVKHLSDAATEAEAQAQKEMLLQQSATEEGMAGSALEAAAPAVTQEEGVVVSAPKQAPSQAQQSVSVQSAQAAATMAQPVAYADSSYAAAQRAAEEQPVTAQGGSTYTDLTSPEALQARELYSQQKLESMKSDVISRIRNTKGVRIYFRNNLPDAIDIDGDVIFQGNRFNPDALPLLDDIYSLMALTQGASYIILPAGSYTDDVTLSGIRQAMALNSFFVHKGISSGKISYNMGLYDQEPPAKFANLEGLSIVFDFEAQLPSAIAQANQISKRPLLSIAVVPVSNEIDPAKGEAFAIDFSVIETVNPVNNWIFQVVQHGKDGKYYVVRQLEGFAPVYHQILWNGRKGIIGPELDCGKYTLVLTVTDSTGEKKTIRRQITVKCGEQKAAETESNLCTTCDYKTPRLWTKPGRKMAAPAESATATYDTTNMGGTNTNTVNIYEETLPAGSLDNPASASYPAPTDPNAFGAPVASTTTTGDPYAVPSAEAANPYAATTGTDPYAAQPAAAATTADPYGTGANNNPYDMPYETYDSTASTTTAQQ